MGCPYLQDRYVIIHSGDAIWHLSNVLLNEDKKEITASLSDVEHSHTLYPLKRDKNYRVYHPSKSKKTLELHFYTNEIINKDNSQVIIPFASIGKMEVYQPDTGMKVLSILGFTVGSLAFVAILIAALKSSCPFIYIKDGNSYSFAGELYPGAILPSLERDDYIALPGFNPKNEEYELKITNELLEIQYTDLTQLIVVKKKILNLLNFPSLGLNQLLIKQDCIVNQLL